MPEMPLQSHRSGSESKPMPPVEGATQVTLCEGILAFEVPVFGSLYTLLDVDTGKKSELEPKG